MKKKYTAYASPKRRKISASRACGSKSMRRGTSKKRITAGNSLGISDDDLYALDRMFRKNEQKKYPEYCGVPGVEYMYQGTWSDPILRYKGEYYNIYDVEDSLLYDYREEHPEDENDAGFEDWLHDNPDYVYDQLYDLTPYSKSECKRLGLPTDVKSSRRTSKKRITAAKVYTDGLGSYEPWSGAKDTWRNLEKFDCIDALEQYLDEVYYNESMGEGVINETELNDLLWFEPEVVYEAVGLYYDSDADEVSDEPFDDDDYDEE